MNYGNTGELKNLVPKLGEFVSFNYTFPLVMLPLRLFSGRPQGPDILA